MGNYIFPKSKKKYKQAPIVHGQYIGPLDKFQTRLLSELGISLEDALVYVNLAPLSCRRDMGMMGLLHRTAFGKGPEHFKKFFRQSTAERLCTRSGTWRRNRQLIDIRNQHFLEIERRSALGLICVYNRLPAEIARHDTVKVFQTSMQHLLKDRLAAGCTDWMSTLSRRAPAYCHPIR